MKHKIPTNWEIVEWPPLRLKGDYLVTDRAAAPCVRSASASDKRSRLHRRLADAVTKQGTEVALKEDWQGLALEFANDYFPPVAETSVAANLRVPVARFGEESLLMWWTMQLGLELARGAENGSLDAALRAAVQIWGLRMPGRGRAPTGWLPGLSRIDHDAEAWIGVFASTLPKRRQRDDGLSAYVQQMRFADHAPAEVESLPFDECQVIVSELKKHRSTASERRAGKRRERLQDRAERLLGLLQAERYGKGWVRRNVLRTKRSLSGLNAEIRLQARAAGIAHGGVIAIGGPESPEQELWDLAARVFVSTVNSRLTGAIVTCLAEPTYGEVAHVTPGLRFMTPLARIWFDYWKDLSVAVEVRTCKVCGDAFAARRRTQLYCCRRCRKTAETRARRG